MIYDCCDNWHEENNISLRVISGKSDWKIGHATGNL